MRTSKILSLILTVMMIIGVLPVVSSAAGTANADYFDFSDAVWVADNYGGAIDESKSYTEEKPYLLSGSSGVTVSHKTENGESFTRVSKSGWPWLIMRFPSLAGGKYVKIKFRPSAENAYAQFRWLNDNTATKYTFEGQTSDANGWYTAIIEVKSSKFSADNDNKYWGMLVPSGYVDIKYAVLADYFEPDVPITAATIDGIDAKLNIDNHKATVDAECNLTAETIGVLSEENVKITLKGDGETAVIIAGSAKITGNDSHVISSVQYDITTADGETQRWTFEKHSQNSRVFDFTDEAWVKYAYGGVVDEVNYATAYEGLSPYFITGNSASTVKTMSENGENFTRISASAYPWIMVRFPEIKKGKYVRLKIRPSEGNTKINMRWFWDPTRGVAKYFSDYNPDENGWYTIVHQIEETGNRIDMESKTWGFHVSKGYFDIKLAEIGDYFEEEKNISPITAAVVDGIDATVDFDNLKITAVAEGNLTEETIGTLGDDNVEFTFYSDEEYADIVAGTEKIEKTATSVISSVQYDVSAADGTITRWTVSKISYGDVVFDFADAEWVNASGNNGGIIDESITYSDEKPYFVGGNSTSIITSVTENGETFARVTAGNYPWIVLRMPGLKAGGYLKVVVRPSDVNTSVSARWVFQSDRGVKFNLDELTPDENGWYTMIARIPESSHDKDNIGRLFGVHTTKGYMDIKSAEYSQNFEDDEETKIVVASAKVDGKDAFVDAENHIISVDTTNKLTVDSIGSLSQNDVELALGPNVTAVCKSEVSFAHQTIAYVSCNLLYEITDANGETATWTIRRVSRNGYIFDFTDNAWVKAHMSQKLYPVSTNTLFTDEDPLLMPTNDDEEPYIELKAINNDEMSCLRVELLKKNKWNWTVLRLDEMTEGKYVKYIYRAGAYTVAPRWVSGTPVDGTKTVHLANKLYSGDWFEYKGKIGSCMKKNYDLPNHALAVHTSNQSFDLRYVACFDTQEEMEAFDPSIESATIGGVFGKVDNINHTVMFDKNAGELDDVVFNLYTGSVIKKQGNAYVYPSGLKVQKYVATDYEGKATVWTVQLGVGEAPQLMCVNADGSITFDACLDNEDKYAAIYSETDELINVKKVDGRKTSFDVAQTIGENIGKYTVKAFAWKNGIALPIADVFKKQVSFGNFMIFGDSYSTFGGHIPSGYATWYTPGGHENTDVTEVEETWWRQLLKMPGNNLLRNDSWSGSTICTTGYDGVDASQSSAFVYRLDTLISQGYFDDNDVDTVFIFGGTNDSWGKSPIGTIKYDNITTEDLKSTLPAMSYMIKRINEVSPDTKVVCILNSALSNRIACGYREICDHYGAQYVQIYDLSMKGGHPDIAGMIQIKDAILDAVR